jgi:hypothetical protein
MLPHFAKSILPCYGMFVGDAASATMHCVNRLQRLCAIYVKIN